MLWLLDKGGGGEKNQKQTKEGPYPDLQVRENVLNWGHRILKSKTDDIIPD